jgi:hypothetical protein
MNVHRSHPVLEMALVVGSPLLLAVVEVIHPHLHDFSTLDVHAWLAVHYAQIALFPLTALALAWWVRGEAGVAAAICRVAMFVFAASWTAWDAVAGVATGILVSAARGSGTPEVWRAPIDAIWLHPIMGGGGVPLLGVAGSLALSVGAVAAAVVMKRRGHSWAPLAVFAICSFGIGIFRTHAWPGGPLTFGGIAIASAWLLWERARVSSKADI